MTLLSGSVRADFVYPDFGSIAGLQLNGNASQAGNRLRLVPAMGGQSGSAYFTQLQTINTGFITNFAYQVTNPGGTSGTSPPPADGFTFIVQNSPQGLTALGGSGGQLGFGSPGGIANSVAVEFDTHNNLSGAGDPNEEHIAVDTLGTLPNSASQASLRGIASTPGLIRDLQIHQARITYAPGSISIYIDNFVTPRLTVPIDLASTLSLNGGQAYVGFTAGTGTGFGNFDILNWQFQAVPEPSTLVMGSTSVLAGLGCWWFRRRRRAVT
jgi:hypothetical protein